MEGQVIQERSLGDVPRSLLQGKKGGNFDGRDRSGHNEK